VLCLSSFLFRVLVGQVLVLVLVCLVLVFVLVLVALILVLVLVLVGPVLVNITADYSQPLLHDISFTDLFVRNHSQPKIKKINSYWCSRN